MSEHHAIAGPARGETLAPGRVGARVRLPLDSAPTPRWSDAMAANLVASLTGHAAVGHLKLDQAVQGCDIVLEGVEPAEAEQLGPVLRTAIDAANRICDCDPAIAEPPNMPQAQADEVARGVDAGARLGSPR
jgi:hypothetical protein